jgi:hypothetical protein
MSEPLTVNIEMLQGALLQISGGGWGADCTPLPDGGGVTVVLYSLCAPHLRCAPIHVAVHPHVTGWTINSGAVPGAERVPLTLVGGACDHFLLVANMLRWAVMDLAHQLRKAAAAPSTTSATEPFIPEVEGMADTWGVWEAPVDLVVEPAPEDDADTTGGDFDAEQVEDVAP